MNWLIKTLLFGNRVPRVIDPKTHKSLDFLTTAAFLMIAGAFWGRHRRAAATALINGGTVLGATMLTDYDGDGRRPISFPKHGQIDVVQASMASGLPVVLGFTNHFSASIFETQAMIETLVVAATDWEAAGRSKEVRAA
jgi:hypothetical protein